MITATPGAGTLFPQPRLVGGLLMDEHGGCGWRLVLGGFFAHAGAIGLTWVDLACTPETEGVVAQWMHRHGAHAAIVRPDHVHLRQRG